MQYLDIVNNVLQRLRESTVSSVSDNSYSKMIGIFVNDAKKQVEDSYNWSALLDTTTVVTSPAIFSYAMTGTGQRFKVLDVFNDTSDVFMKPMTTSEATAFFLSQSTNGQPCYYYFNGTDSNGDTVVDVFPRPDGVYNLRFNFVLPQTDLTNNTDKLKIPSQPVIYLAYAKALAERGEDGGLASNEAYGLYKESLADAIAIESSRYVEEQQWIAN
jgi:hypothetical protein